MIETLPSVRWDVVQAPAIAIKADLYQGHLPDGSSVQAHSADRYYAVYGIVMVATYSVVADRHVWTATRHGMPIITGYRHDATLAAAVGLITGA